ncbi:methylenetetrahydrofolate--tRNA-(uracil(54)-C(5))-methyltransferase (FADH(2)-oxidizing) TrmFO [Zongyangia hominis]|uniref:Methylenetetrahydrofolate--tRNA-(uracil-5-)-methyltransferase TrmFO n=1 Tax=Zongyangia hominis TaxID=2763677 RepID=A0A926EBE8_9FIRM|nr:methylenetetrahydrofolate--tRNA-(uracil(54)-C(5))-methyltransferase (FADH(2)-oxidizing) TrmFO [Zongyangia hominis]MBC8569254.1 methylenetetrahydrofolate--tRNA-(uracil(54)-C(5))-methyltransferase (FADH(2)-oxidizing) TrmFO [Zongyangia hominis]
MRVTVIGAGLAGCEAAWQLARFGIEVTLYEMKPKKYTPAHHYPGMAELICSNSLKAMRLESAAGLLKEEMSRLGSLLVPCAKACAVAAGGALAVDREAFSDLVTDKIRREGHIEVVEEELTAIPEGPVIVATGPLTSDALSDAIRKKLGEEYLSFFDAAAPIVTAESLDKERCFFAARYGRGDDDYINCPFSKEEYVAFYEALVHAQSVQLKAFEKEGLKVYEGCMPVEVLAKRGPDTLRFGPLKPVGLRDPRTGHRPWAVVQLRRENAAGSLYNLVGFQTNLLFGEQKRVFSMIPGLENAEFVRYGVMHRNTFLDSPRLLDQYFRLKKEPRIFFAGQMTGVEGYMESAASGLLAGVNMALTLTGKEPLTLPFDTMTGALSRYISDGSVKDFQPMGANMGLLPPPLKRERDKVKRYAQVSERALGSLDAALKERRGDLPG